MLTEAYHHDMPTSRDSLEATLPRRPPKTQKEMKKQKIKKNINIKLKIKYNS